MSGVMGGAVAAFIVAVIWFVITAIFWASRYKRCPSDRILVVTGRVGVGQKFKCIHGGGAFIWPLVQNYFYLSLTPAVVDVPLDKAFPKAGTLKKLALKATVAISAEPAIVNNAAMRLVDLPTEQLIALARNAIYQALETGFSSAEAEKVIEDRKNFLDAVQKNVELELNKLGLSLINVSISGEPDKRD